MSLLIALFLGAGVAAFTYTKMGRRVGYGNYGSVITVVGVTFVISTVIAFTVFKTLGV
jgi:hypothetical protein